MNHLLLPRMDYRHLVFPDLSQSRLALNLAPSSRDPADAAPADGSFRLAVPDALDPAEAEFVNWLLRQGGLDVNDYRPESLRRRLPACLRVLGVQSVARAQLILRRQPELLPKALSAVVIGVTSFFRDPSVFDALAAEVLPSLRGEASPLRVWSAGCSDGQELYSVAMLLAEAMRLDDAELLGTDCRAQAISAAISGRYDAAAMESVPSDWQDKYFTHDGGAWEVSESLRHATRWEIAALPGNVAPCSFDLILCRNLAIYLELNAAERLWAHLITALRPGGVLGVGKAERPAALRTLKQVGPCLYRRPK